MKHLIENMRAHKENYDTVTKNIMLSHVFNVQENYIRQRYDRTKEETEWIRIDDAPMVDLDTVDTERITK